MEEQMSKEKLIEEIQSEHLHLERTLEKTPAQQMVTSGVMDDGFTGTYHGLGTAYDPLVGADSARRGP